jgi:AAA ATPase domain
LDAVEGLLARALVGRDEQRRALADVVAAASRGQGSAVALVAEAGLGKSRLRTEAERVAADAGLVVLSGRAVEGAGARPLRAVAEAVAGARRDDGIRADGTTGLLGPTLARLDEVAAHPPDAAVPVGVVGLAEAVLIEEILSPDFVWADAPSTIECFATFRTAAPALAHLNRVTVAHTGHVNFATGELVVEAHRVADLARRSRDVAA